MSDQHDSRPTRKLALDEILRLAREADAQASAAETIGAAITLPPPPLPPDTRRVLEPNDEGAGGAHSKETPVTTPAVVHTDGLTGDPDGPGLSSIPSVLLTEEDLSFFSLKPASRAVLGVIDGVSTVESILSRVTIPRTAALGALRELGARGIVDFHLSPAPALARRSL
jgi:hypothetical protein